MSEKRVKSTRPRTYLLLAKSMRGILNGSTYSLRREKVAIEELKKDKRYYQREVEDADINAIVDVWCDALVDDLIVSERENKTKWIIDGGHRVEGAKRLGIESLWARVYRGLSVEQEAAIYTLLNSTRKPLNHHDFHAGAKGAKEPRILEEEKVIARHGCYIPRQPIVDGKAINCVKHIDRLCLSERFDGLAILDTILGIITKAWDSTQAHRLDSYVFKGLIYLFTGKLGKLLIPDQMASALSKTTADKFHAKVLKLKDAMPTLSKAAGMVLLQQYNKGLRRNRLSIDALALESGGKE